MTVRTDLGMTLCLRLQQNIYINQVLVGLSLWLTVLALLCTDLLCPVWLHVRNIQPSQNLIFISTLIDINVILIALSWTDNY